MRAPLLAIGDAEQVLDHEVVQVHDRELHQHHAVQRLRAAVARQVGVLQVQLLVGQHLHDVLVVQLRQDPALVVNVLPFVALALHELSGEVLDRCRFVHVDASNNETLSSACQESHWTKLVSLDFKQTCILLQELLGSFLLTL